MAVASQASSSANRVVFVNRYFFPDHSATSQLLSDLAFHFAQRGYSVVVVTSRLRYQNSMADLRARETVQGVDVHRVWTSRFGRRFALGRIIDYMTFYASAGWCLFRVLGPGDVLIAKTDPPLISVPGLWVASWRGAGMINWLQDLFPEVAERLELAGFSGHAGHWLKRLRDHSLRQALLNVVPGHRMADLLGRGNLAREKIRMIPNWADGNAIMPVPVQNNTLRREWGLEHRLVVGYSGNLGRAHEHDTILGAALELQSERDVVFLFIGGGREFEALKKAASKRGLHNLVFRPYQPRDRLSLSLPLPDVHLVVLRPELEGLITPSKFSGIVAAGRPTLFIGAKNGEIPRILDETASGLAVETGDVKALVELIRQLRDEPRLRQRMGRQARRMFEQKYDKVICLSAWEQVLQEALSVNCTQGEAK